MPKDPLGFGFNLDASGAPVLNANPPGSGPMSAAIVIDGLHKSYRRKLRSPAVAALRGVTLTVEAGEAFGFIGANGAGKSTAIKILMGLIAASAGSARIFGTFRSTIRARAWASATFPRTPTCTIT
jgi:ABC-type uncharacterized transport system ATPase subunit